MLDNAITEGLQSGSMMASALSLQLATEARAFARKLGLLRPLALLRIRILKRMGRGEYEQAFDDALHAVIRKDDVVWDVGANLGLYTTKFADWTGPQGQVVAFEPVPTCFAELSQRVQDRPQVRALQRALGDTDQTTLMNMSDDPLAATHSFATHDQGTTSISVQVSRGDSLVRELGLKVPNVIKVDVEGFEGEVLAGLGTMLDHPSCRAVLIEVHFGILDQRGKRQAPVEICNRLRAAGFELRWVDASHLVATRSEAKPGN